MLLQSLRTREIDLKEFCRRVRLLMGPQGEHVLKACVEGLQKAQREKIAAANAGRAGQLGAATSAGAAAPPVVNATVGATVGAAAATVTANTDNPAAASGAASAPAGGAKLEAPPLPLPSGCVACSASATAPPTAPPTVLSLGPLPSPPNAPPPVVSPPKVAAKPEGGKGGGGKGGGGKGGGEGRKEGSGLGTKVLVHALLCPRENDTCRFNGCNEMKKVLRRVELHTKSCSISNLPGGQDDCTTCNKWQSMIKLKEHYRRKLIHYMKETFSKEQLVLQGGPKGAAAVAAAAAAGPDAAAGPRGGGGKPAASGRPGTAKPTVAPAPISVGGPAGSKPHPAAGRKPVPAGGWAPHQLHAIQQTLPSPMPGGGSSSSVGSGSGGGRNDVGDVAKLLNGGGGVNAHLDNFMCAPSASPPASSSPHLASRPLTPPHLLTLPPLAHTFAPPLKLSHTHQEFAHPPLPHPAPPSPIPARVCRQVGHGNGDGAA